MRSVFVVVSESGEYDDWYSYVESVHVSYDSAVRWIEHVTKEVFWNMDAQCYVDEYAAVDDDGHLLPSVISVFMHPHKRSELLGSDEVWDVMGDMLEMTYWHIEERPLLGRQLW